MWDAGHDFPLRGGVALELVRHDSQRCISLPLEQLSKETRGSTLPTQVWRGDGVRDSRLGEVERLIDLYRLLLNPQQIGPLSDYVSPVDAATAVAKIESVLVRPNRSRFEDSNGECAGAPLSIRCTKKVCSLNE